MKQRSFLSMALAGCLATLAACSSAEVHPTYGPATQAAPRPARISHVVMLKLNEPGDTDEIVADSDAMLAPIPGVVSYAAGTHLDTGRDSVLHDYDVALYIGFDEEGAYAGYVEHPDHVAYVTKWLPRLEWLKVYDVVDDTP